MVKLKNKFLFILLCLFSISSVGQDTGNYISSFSKINKEAYNKRLNVSNSISWRGKRLNFHDYFAKPISGLFETIGEPDYQSGWLGFCDTGGVSIISGLFNESYPNSEIPIKVYAWKKGGKYLLCFCIYDNEDMFTSFPLTYRWGRWESILEWFSFHSGDDYRLLYWGVSISLEGNLPFLQFVHPIWSLYSERKEKSVKEFYFDTFGTHLFPYEWTGYIAKLSEVKGIARMEMISRMGEPVTSNIYRNDLPTFLRRETFLIRESIDSYVKVDRYPYGLDNNIDFFYDENDILIFMSVGRDDYFYIEE